METSIIAQCCDALCFFNKNVRQAVGSIDACSMEEFGDFDNEIFGHTRERHIADQPSYEAKQYDPLVCFKFFYLKSQLDALSVVVWLTFVSLFFGYSILVIFVTI